MKHPSLTNNLTKHIISLFGLFAFLLLLIAGCSSPDKNDPEKLIGKWDRTDGNYTIHIKAAMEGGKLDAAYYNPDPINVGRAGWRVEDEQLQIYVELRDENYPGSIYQLTYDIETETLSGTYYQALARQTYEVKFTRNN